MVFKIIRFCLPKSIHFILPFTQLRKYLYLAVIELVVNNPSFKSWHEHNIQVLKMKKQRSIFKLIGKLARILIGMARNKEFFNPERTLILKKDIAA